MSERDPSIRRIERYALVWAGVLTAAALAIDPARPRAAVGVLGGAALVAFSYWAIKRGVDAILAAAAEKRSGRIVWHVVAFAGRYALLAGIAYVMIARFRLHPVGLLVGASSIVLAIATEAVRGGRSKSR